MPLRKGECPSTGDWRATRALLVTCRGLVSVCPVLTLAHTPSATRWILKHKSHPFSVQYFLLF